MQVAMISTFPERLRNILEETGIRQTDLCDKAGIGKSAMSQYLHGAFVPKQKKLSAIAEALDVSESWLMGYDVPRRRVAMAIAEDSGERRLYEMIARDDSMAGAYIPKGARVVLKRFDAGEKSCEELGELNGEIVSIVIKDGREMLRFIHRDGDRLLVTAADTKCAPQVFDVKDLEDGTLKILGVAERVEIRF